MWLEKIINSKWFSYIQIATFILVIYLAFQFHRENLLLNEQNDILWQQNQFLYELLKKKASDFILLPINQWNTQKDSQ